MNLFWYFHPWRVVTFIIGVYGLLLGAILEQVPDWNADISILMVGALGTLAYLGAWK